MAETDIMTKSDRDSLIKIIRQRERLAKTDAKMRSADMMADFQEQLARTYNFDESEVWSKAKKSADAAVAEARRIISEECEKLGIPAEFAPSIDSYWYNRGQQLSKERRSELTRVATAHVTALEAAARLAIERRSVELQEQVMVSGLTSGQAQQFLSSIPTVDQLMPSVTVDQAKGLLAHKKVEN